MVGRRQRSGWTGQQSAASGYALNGGVGDVEAVVRRKLIRVEVDEGERAGCGQRRRIGRAAELAEKRIRHQATVSDLENI